MLGWRSTNDHINHMKDIHAVQDISNHAHLIMSTAGMWQLKAEVHVHLTLFGLYVAMSKVFVESDASTINFSSGSDTVYIMVTTSNLQYL